MSEENFGYEPPNLSRYGESAPDYVDPEARARPGEIYDQGAGQAQNDVEKATIDEMWMMVTRESDEYAYALSSMWGRVSTLLEATRGNLADHGRALSAKWESPAAEEFLRRVGGGLLSLEEWRTAAARNSTTLANIGQSISQAQAEMRVIWQEYQEATAREASDRGGLGLGDFNPLSDEFLGSDSQDEVRQRYTERARPVMRALADAYMDGYIYGLDRAVPYQGPTNAAVRFPGAAPARPNAPAAPAGAAPAAPSRGAAPPAPNRGPAPARPAAPPAPTRAPTRGRAPARPNAAGPTLAGRGAPPPAPTRGAPPPSPTTTRGAAPPSPLASPGAGLARGAAPSRPTLPPASPAGRGGTPGRPGLPPGTPRLNGRQGAPPSVPGQRGGAPGRPGSTIPPSSAGLGRPPGSRPGAPGAPVRGGGPGAPGLPPGAPGTRRPGSPPGRPAEPPAIGKTKPAAPGTGRPGSPLAPGAGAPPARGTRPGEPKPVGKAPTRGGVPGAALHAPTNPTLSGRQKPGSRAGTGSARAAGVQPELKGRGVPHGAGGPPSAAPAAKQRRRGAADPTFKSDLTEDEKLWKVEESAPAVIDQQAEQARKDPKPMLGSA